MRTITEGTTVGDFELPDETGAPRRLSGLLEDGPVVLFFYPGALTSGCTTEGCHFRDLAGEFAAAGVQRVGISADPVDRQRRFSETNAFDYPLLSDPDGAVATQFGVRRKYVTPVKRATFVIDRDRAVRKVITSEMNMTRHADEALEFARSL